MGRGKKGRSARKSCTDGDYRALRNSVEGRVNEAVKIQVTPLMVCKGVLCSTIQSKRSTLASWIKPCESKAPSFSVSTRAV